MTRPTPPTMHELIAALLSQPEGTMTHLSRGLVIELTNNDPLTIELFRENAFPSPIEVAIVKRSLEKITGHANTYEGTDYKEWRNHKDEITKRWGLAILTSYPLNTTAEEEQPPPITYPPTAERLLTVPIRPTYPD